MNEVVLAGSVSTHRFDRLTVFTFVWAMVRFFHQISFPDWVLYQNKRNYLLTLVVLLALWCPKSILLLMLLLASSIYRTLEWMPYTPNHFLFELYVDAGILFSLVYSLTTVYWHAGSPSNALVREQIFKGFAPMARISIMILYFYAVFHKLNWDYFNPEISCGTFLTRGLLEHLHIHYLPYWGKLVAVWGTLLIETLIPVLFLFRATRRWSILLGLVFHFILAIHPHPGLYSFSSLLIGFFYLFTPPSFNDSLAAQFDRWRERFRTTPYRIGGLLVLATILFFWIYEYRQGGFRQAAFVFWYIWWVGVFAVYLRFLFTKPITESSFRKTFGMRPRVMWIFVLVVFLNGLSPYIGLKTQTSYSMFSNLRTEGKVTNHLFMPRCLLTTYWQDDLVTVIRTNAPPLQEFTDGKRMITYFELRRTVSEMRQDFFVDYRRGPQQRHLEVRKGVSTDPELSRPYSWPMKKLMRFRPIYTDTCRCQH